MCPAARNVGRGGYDMLGTAITVCVCVLLLFCLQIKYGDTATSEGVLFATYSALIGESQAGGQHRTRLKQILEWCRENFEGVVSLKKNQKNQQPKTGERKREELLLVIVLQQGTKSLGPCEVTGSSCGSSPVPAEDRNPPHSNLLLLLPGCS